jgi:hypothetical protein
MPRWVAALLEWAATATCNSPLKLIDLESKNEKASEKSGAFLFIISIGYKYCTIIVNFFLFFLLLNIIVPALLGFSSRPQKELVAVLSSTFVVVIAMFASVGCGKLSGVAVPSGAQPAAPEPTAEPSAEPSPTPSGPDFSWDSYAQKVADYDFIYPEEPCVKLEIGQSAMIRGYKTTVPSSYRLERLQNTSEGRPAHEVKFNIQFTEVEGEENKGARERLLRKIKACLDVVNPVRSRDGMQLWLKLADGTENSLPAVSEVFVQHLVERANSQLVSDESSCGTLVHELLHHTGLVDKYEESDPEKLYDCRTLGPRDSIMYDSRLRPRKIQVILGCTCEGNFPYEGDQGEMRKECLLEVRAMKGNPITKEWQEWIMDGTQPIPNNPICPGKSQIVFRGNRWSDIDLKVMDDQEKIAAGFAYFDKQFEISRNGILLSNESYEFSVEVEKPETMPFVLYPAEMRAIVYPGCVDKNATYYGCANNAYRRSDKHGGCKTYSQHACGHGTDWLM